MFLIFKIINLKFIKFVLESKFWKYSKKKSKVIFKRNKIIFFKMMGCRRNTLNYKAIGSHPHFLNAFSSSTLPFLNLYLHNWMKLMNYPLSTPPSLYHITLPLPMLILQKKMRDRKKKDEKKSRLKNLFIEHMQKTCSEKIILKTHSTKYYTH